MLFLLIIIYREECYELVAVEVKIRIIKKSNNRHMGSHMKAEGRRKGQNGAGRVESTPVVSHMNTTCCSILPITSSLPFLTFPYSYRKYSSGSNYQVSLSSLKISSSFLKIICLDNFSFNFDIKWRLGSTTYQAHFSLCLGNANSPFRIQKKEIRLILGWREYYISSSKVPTKNRERFSSLKCIYVCK